MNWLLLRGWGREQRHWENFPSHLAKTTGAGVHCLDLPGVGTEHTRKSPSSIQAIVEDVRSRWLKTSASSPWAVVGISLGGMVALDWVIRYPDDFKKMVLINSSNAALSPPWHRLRLSALPKVLRAIVANDAVAREKLVLELTTHLPQDEIEKISRKWASFSPEAPVSRSTVAKQLLAALRYRPQSWPKTPSLVFCSERDGLVNPDCSKQIHQKLGSPILFHPGAGHDLPLEEPQWLSEQIQKWASLS
jgi:pimeloyl-ACP methyl ester carboxylesterase